MRSKHKYKEEKDENVHIENSTGRIVMFVVYAPDVFIWLINESEKNLGVPVCVNSNT